MALFKISDSKLRSLKEIEFESYFRKEKELQNLTENNLQELFGLEFVSSEFNLETFWLDSLAFDESSKSFVIIEYKKVENTHVMDQGQTYLNLVLDHKGDVLQEYFEKIGKPLKKNEVDWSQTRVIFIGPKFNTYQKRALNSRNPFELWEVLMYEDGLIEYDQILPASLGKNGDKKTLFLKGTAAKEIKVYEETDTLRRSGKSKELYKRLKEKILEIDNSLIFRPTKYYIGVLKEGNWRMILSINVHKDNLLLDYTRSEPKDFNDPKKKLFYHPNSLKHFHQHLSSLDVKSLEDVEYAAFLFEQAYRRFNKQFV